ncbi:hypothetical protein RHGRI_026764 [Rhododendron griersonianum]|uniref:Uncharacterized protein n=1 Tax=Rhododendron griersonianum TaxID=479676 RepID=A0AAV6IU18_9ERIC|nr:hypothetical protein RHGRI_026764 [Rhododendron griersonianum]
MILKATGKTSFGKMNKMGKQLSLPSARRKLKQERIGSDTLRFEPGTYLDQKEKLIKYSDFSGQYLRLQVAALMAGEFISNTIFNLNEFPTEGTYTTLLLISQHSIRISDINISCSIILFNIASMDEVLAEIGALIAAGDEYPPDPDRVFLKDYEDENSMDNVFEPFVGQCFLSKEEALIFYKKKMKGGKELGKQKRTCRLCKSVGHNISTCLENENATFLSGANERNKMTSTAADCTQFFV